MKTALNLALLYFALLASAPLWSQVEPSATGGDVISPVDDLHMAIPPPISGRLYSTEFSSESKSNYVAGGVAFTAAYTDNLLSVQTTHQVSDEIYSVVPNFSFERKTPRQLQSLSYALGFTFYQHTSDLNAITQSAEAEYQYHPSRYSTISVRDDFSQNSNAFNQVTPVSGGSVAGLPQVSSTVVVAPFENQITNAASGDATWQFARDAMIGGGGSYQLLNYENLSNVPGLNDSNITGASAFYSRRVSRGQYLGANYLYSRIATHPEITTTNTHAILGFYTIYLNRTSSLSISAGPQHYDVEQSPNPSHSAWAPAVSGTFGWESARANVAASYSHIVSGGQGLTGAYHSDLANASARWLFSRTWTGEVSGGYSNYNSVTPLGSFANQGGHTLVGTAAIQHKFGEILSGELGYSHFHQSYGQIQAVSSFPDSNRVYMSINCKFRKPIGR
jgi:hypothetical protein